MTHNMFEEGKGLFDFILLDQVNHDAFMDNLTTRFNQGLIFTNIGEQVISVNPFKALPDPPMDRYVGKYQYEVPPHCYSVAEAAFRAALMGKDQCCIITGESGAGKTFASKIFMKYIAFVSAGSGEADAIKNKLLKSNPILEAFGNAKTLRNDNSSRFGKYMQLDFDLAGTPLGGEISQYLLEKSRVVTRAQGERSFHIFYQILSQPALLGNLQLTADPSYYYYLSMSSCYTVNTINDASDYQEVVDAMRTLGWAKADFGYVCELLAAILHLGNCHFQEDVAKTRETNTDCVEVTDWASLEAAARLLQVDATVLNNAITTRTITTGFGARKNEITVQLDMEQAVFARDALAKELYARIFLWVGERLNDKLKSQVAPGVRIGILDIYGFEIFEENSFEQFCINYCNEKLQQYFINNVLRSEQEEYIREGIQWTEIDYFDNQPIISLIEGSGKRTPSIVALLDESCLVGQATPRDVVDKLTNAFSGNSHFDTASSSRDRHLGPSDFRIHHYAGQVVYSANQFLDKNRDQLNSDIVRMCVGSGHRLLKYLFRDADKLLNNKKRPETAGHQFRRAVCDLVDTLQRCEPHFIRCIKSNEEKRALYMDRERVDHQVVYLNLVETVRVRKAGFCSRMHYQRFLWRYKLLTNNTWPHWHGSDYDGCLTILNDIGIQASDYQMGKTKVFIKEANVFMYLEQMRSSVLPELAILIQKNWRRYAAVKWYQEHRAAMQERLRYTRAANKIIKCYLRHKLRTDILALWYAFGGAAQDPYFGKYTQWPTVWPRHETGVAYMYQAWRLWWAFKMVSTLSPEEQSLMRQKILTMDLFSGNKPWNCARHFAGDYLGQPSNPLQGSFVAAVQILLSGSNDSRVIYADTVTKINPKGKPQPRAFLVTENNMYKYEAKKADYKMKKTPIPLAKIVEIRISQNQDQAIVIAMEPPIRDLVLDAGLSGVNERLSELVVVLYEAYYSLTGNPLPIKFESGAIRFNNSRVPDPNNPSVLKKPGTECSLLLAPKNAGQAGPGMVFGKLKKGVLQGYY